MARPGRPERNKAARSFRQLRRFHHGFNSDKVFGTHIFDADEKTLNYELLADESFAEVGVYAENCESAPRVDPIRFKNINVLWCQSALGPRAESQSKLWLSCCVF